MATIDPNAPPMAVSENSFHSGTRFLQDLASHLSQTKIPNAKRLTAAKIMSLLCKSIY